MNDSSPASPKLLSGVKVLDFTQYLAGPAATRLFADFGAEVIKIERTPDGDLGRKIHFVAPGISAFFLAVSAGKKSVALSFETKAGRTIVRELVRQADVVIENYSPGVMAKYGFDYASLKAIKPDLVMASISGFGQHGPYARQPSFDIVAQAQSGVMAMTGEPDGPPQYVGNYFGDPNAGIHAAFAVAAALFQRGRSGDGQYIDVSQLESLVYLDYVNFPLAMMSDGRIKPHRFGGDFFNICPYGTYRSKQGYIVFAVAEHQWGPLVRAMGRPELEHDSRYATQEGRCARRPEVRAVIEAWLAGFDDDRTPLAILAEARVPSAPILEIEQVPEHEQIKARAVYQQVGHPELGPVPIARSPFRFSTVDNTIPFRAPYLGEHNEAVLGGYLGYDEARMRALYADGVLVQDPKVGELGAAVWPPGSR
ncbi:MAG: CoA transferase [Gammaproteobacteria bacterium]|nr:CoA transferase [Gammaproteobacteria bacterium]